MALVAQYMMAQYSNNERIIVFNIVIHAPVVKYLRIFDNKYNLCDTIFLSSSMPLINAHFFIKGYLAHNYHGSDFIMNNHTVLFDGYTNDCKK